MHTFRLCQAFDQTGAVPMAASYYEGWLEALPRHDIVAEAARQAVRQCLNRGSSALLSSLSAAVLAAPRKAPSPGQPEHLLCLIPNALTRRD